MVTVDTLFVGSEYGTEVWISKRASKELKKLIRKGKGTEFVRKLKHYAQSGFSQFETKGGPIRHEWNEVWRIAYSSSLFRLVGFYADPRKAKFIVIDDFKKSGQSLSSRERDRINEVARVKDEGDWRISK